MTHALLLNILFYGTLCSARELASMHKRNHSFQFWETNSMNLCVEEP